MGVDAETQKAFVTGATGCIGTALTQRLSKDGWQVVVLARDESKAAHLAGLPGVAVVVGDLDSRDRIRSSMTGCNVVFHLAAKVHSRKETTPGEFVRVNVDGTRNVLEAAVDNGVEQFVFASTIAVYGENQNVLREETHPAPVTPYGASKLEAELVVMSRANQIGVTVLRLPLVYGPRDRGNFARMVRAIARRRFVLIGNGQNVKSMAAVENVVGAAMLTVTDPRARGQTYLVCDPRDYTMAEIVRTIADAVDRRRSFPHFPSAPFLWLGRSADAIGALTGISLPLSAATVQTLTSTNRCSAERIQRELGFVPDVSLTDRVASIVREVTG